MHIYSINDYVKVVNDVNGEWFNGSEGIIEDVSVNKQGDTIYGIRFVKKENPILNEIENAVYYFLGREIEIAERECEN